MPKPIPTAIITKMTGKLTDTAATALPPSRPTQNASVSWYALASTLARTIGTAIFTSEGTIGPSSRPAVRREAWVTTGLSFEAPKDIRPHRFDAARPACKHLNANLLHL